MKKSRGDRNSRAEIAKRQTTLAETLNLGMTAEEAMAATGVSRTTIWRDLSSLKEGFQITNKEAFAQYVTSQVGILTKVIEEVWEGALEPEVANSIRMR